MLGSAGSTSTPCSVGKFVCRWVRVLKSSTLICSACRSFQVVLSQLLPWWDSKFQIESTSFRPAVCLHGVRHDRRGARGRSATTAGCPPRLARVAVDVVVGARLVRVPEVVEDVRRRRQEIDLRAHMRPVCWPLLNVVSRPCTASIWCLAVTGVLVHEHERRRGASPASTSTSASWSPPCTRAVVGRARAGARNHVGDEHGGRWAETGVGGEVGLE